MIRVLQFTEMVNRYDVLDNLVQFSDPQKFELSVCLRTDYSNIIRPVFAAHTKYKILPGSNSRRDLLKTAWKLAALLKEWKIDVVHAHGFNEAVIAWLATSFYTRTKFIFGRHYSDLIQNLPGLKRSYYLGLEQKANRAADRIIVPSTYIYDILTKEQKIDAAKIDIIAYGFVAEKYTSISADQLAAVRAELNVDNRFSVATFCKLTEAKGVRFLMEAIVKIKDKIPNLLVFFVGEGDQRGFLEAEIAKHNLENAVKILGWRTDAMAIMANVDVVVQATLSEAFSQVMGEAMWFAKPLVFTDVSGATDIIKNGENGLLVRKSDADSLASAILSLYENRSLREKVAANGRLFMERNLLIENKIKEFENSFVKAVESA